MPTALNSPTVFSWTPSRVLIMSSTEDFKRCKLSWFFWGEIVRRYVQRNRIKRRIEVPVTAEGTARNRTPTHVVLPSKPPGKFRQVIRLVTRKRHTDWLPGDSEASYIPPTLLFWTVSNSCIVAAMLTIEIPSYSLISAVVVI